MTEKTLKTLKISGPYSVVLGNHITIKLPHDSHIQSLLKILAHKRDKVSLHKTMGTQGCHQHLPSISNHSILSRSFYFYQHLLLMASDDFLITIINEFLFNVKWFTLKKEYGILYTYTHTHNEILLSHKKEWNNAIYSNMNGPRDDHIKSDKYMTSITHGIWGKKWYNWTYLQNRNREVKNKYRYQREWEGKR